MSINETCFPVEPPDILSDGTPCIQGFCNKGVCEKSIQDVVERFWDIIEEININKVLRFLRDNLVSEYSESVENVFEMLMNCRFRFRFQ